MSIRFLTPRHRSKLYDAFDEVYLYNFYVLDAAFVSHALGLKITSKTLNRIENEWSLYLDDIAVKKSKSKILAFRINQKHRNQIMLIKDQSIIKMKIQLDTTFKLSD